MKFFNKLFQFFTRPSVVFLLIIGLIAVISVVGTTLIMTQECFSAYVVWGYVSMGIMVASVTYLIYGMIKIAPDVKNTAVKWTENKPFFRKLLSEYGFRTIIFSIVSTVLNLAFAVYNGSVAIVNHSVWFGALSAYYILLMIVRGGILMYHQKRRKAIKNGQDDTQTQINDTKQYGICGIMLTFLPICLSFAILQMVIADESFVYAGITIYVYAIYAFYKIIKAVINFKKTLKSEEMTVRAFRNINLADAMVSILALQTAMIKEFSSAADVSTKTANVVTGAVVCTLSVTIGVFMIARAVLHIKKIKRLLKQEKNMS